MTVLIFYCFILFKNNNPFPISKDNHVSNRNHNILISKEFSKEENSTIKSLKTKVDSVITNQRNLKSDTNRTIRSDSPFNNEQWVDRTGLLLDEIGTFLNANKRQEILQYHGLTQLDILQDSQQISLEKYKDDEDEKILQRRVVALYILSHHLNFSTKDCLTILKNKTEEFKLNSSKSRFIRTNLMFDVLALAKFCARRGMKETENFATQYSSVLSKEMKAQINMGIEYVKEEGI